MTTTDLDAADLDWREHNISGSDRPARMVMLHADPERQTRTVLVEFPPAWKRDAVGHQPAGEEMVILSGTLSISGVTARAGSYLLVEPRATRSATSVEDGTRALVWFSGPGGGWTDGPAGDGGSISTSPVSVELSRVPDDRMPGMVTVHDDLPEQVFPIDVDVLWTDHRRWAHVPSGEPVPALSGQAVGTPLELRRFQVFGRQQVEAEGVAEPSRGRGPDEGLAGCAHHDVTAQRHHRVVQPDQGAQRSRVDAGDTRRVDVEEEATCVHRVLETAAEVHRPALVEFALHNQLRARRMYVQ